MRMLRLESGGRILIDGQLVDASQMENKSEFLASILTLDVELSDDINLSDIVHFFYDLKGFIKTVLSEEYELVRAIVTSTVLPRNYKHIRIYKSFKIENENDEEFIYILPEIEVVPSQPGEDGVRTLSSLSIKIDENIKLTHKDTNTLIDSKTKINLLDVMTCLFEDLAIMLKEGALLS